MGRVKKSTGPREGVPRAETSTGYSWGTPEGGITGPAKVRPDSLLPVTLTEVKVRLRGGSIDTARDSRIKTGYAAHRHTKEGKLLKRWSI